MCSGGVDDSRASKALEFANPRARDVWPSDLVDDCIRSPVRRAGRSVTVQICLLGCGLARENRAPHAPGKPSFIKEGSTSPSFVEAAESTALSLDCDADALTLYCGIPPTMHIQPSVSMTARLSPEMSQNGANGRHAALLGSWSRCLRPD